MPRISLIAALSENRVIGINNHLPWDLPDDWKNFKQVTKGKAFIMGRKSYEAEDPLYSDKINVILSHQDLALPEGFLLAKSVDSALELLKNEDEIFILGGETIFRQTLHLADYMYLTIVHHSFEGDAFFPEIEWKNWKLVRIQRHEKDFRHQYAFSFKEYEKI